MWVRRRTVLSSARARLRRSPSQPTDVRGSPATRSPAPRLTEIGNQDFDAAVRLRTVASNVDPVLRHTRTDQRVSHRLRTFPGLKLASRFVGVSRYIHTQVGSGGEQG